jgi:hypothetical protein
LSNEQTKNKALSAQVEALKKEIESIGTDRRQRVTNLEVELANVTRTRDQLENDKAALTQSERQAVQATKAAQDMLDAKLAEIDKLRIEIFEAYKDRDEKFKNAVAMQDKAIESENEVQRLKENKLTLLAQVAQFKTAADRLGVDIHQPVSGIPPKLDGVVLASRANGLVEISIGSDDGLQRGHEAYIWRNQGGESKFVGKIEIVQTTPEKAVGKVIPSYRKSPIERDDRVVTKLP